MLELQSTRGWQIVDGGRAGAASDSELLAHGRLGDSDALARLFERHESSLLAICLSILGNREDAEDAAQDALLRALRAIGRFREESGFKTWLTRIAINVCLERKRSSRSRISTNWLAGSKDGASPEDSFLQRADIMDALSELPPHRRTAILLRGAHGYSVAEIADSMNWSVARTQNELFRARKQVAKWRADREQQDREGVDR